MKLMFRKEDILDTIRIVNMVADTGHALPPILSHLLISTTDDPLSMLFGSAKDKGIYISATDMEIGIRASAEGQVISAGAVTIPAKKFVSLIKEMPESEIYLTTTADDDVNITCGHAKFRLSGLPADEFPPLIDRNDRKREFVPMSANALLTMIGQTSYAVLRDETRTFLNGVHMSLKDKVIKMAATDGKRLAIAIAELETTTEPKQGIIPIKAMDRLRDMLMSFANVRICLDTDRAIFDAGDISLVSRLIDGEYPDYERVIPSDNHIRLTMETEKLLSIVRRIGTMANPKMPGLMMEINGDMLKVSAKTAEYGEGYEETEIKKEGDDITIGLNAIYLSDALKAIHKDDIHKDDIHKDEVMISMSDPLKPVLMKPVGNDGYICVIMPMRLDSK